MEASNLVLRAVQSTVEEVEEVVKKVLYWGSILKKMMALAFLSFWFHAANPFSSVGFASAPETTSSRPSIASSISISVFQVNQLSGVRNEIWEIAELNKELEAM